APGAASHSAGGRTPAVGRGVEAAASAAQAAPGGRGRGGRTMIASIAVHSLLLGVVLSLCAAAFERVIVALSSRAGRAPARRFVWLAAMAASVLVPLVTGVRPAPGPVEAVVVVGEVIPVGG